MDQASASAGETCRHRQIRDDIGAQIDLIGVPWLMIGY
jgi:hypothetical protein